MSELLHPAALSAADLLAQCCETRTRRSGPGGQHRNKTETAVVLQHLPTGLVAEASERRSQADNRKVATYRLRLRLAIEHRLPALAGATERWQSRCRGNRIVVSENHDDYPALVAEAFDQLMEHGLDMPSTACKLGVTPTQLAGLLKRSRQAWAAINRMRSADGLPKLR